MSGPEKLLTYAEAAVRLTCCKKTVERMVRDGELEKTMVRRRVRIMESEIDRYITRQRAKEHLAPTIWDVLEEDHDIVLSIRARKVLKEFDIMDLEELAFFDVRRAQRLNGVGDKTFRNLVNAVSRAKVVVKNRSKNGRSGGST